MKPQDLSRAHYHSLINSKIRLKSKRYLTDAQAANLDAINAELDRRDEAAARRKADAKLSAAWNAYLFDSLV